MDVQETKDGHFVVMHDANLRHLTGVNGTPQDLTLKELTNLTVTENGVQALFVLLILIWKKHIS